MNANPVVNVEQTSLYLANPRPVDGFLANPTAEYALEPTLAVGFFVVALISGLNNSLNNSPNSSDEGPNAPDNSPDNSPDGLVSVAAIVIRQLV
tara:strand:- start:560 stop:841 length:282 start_codon:yes stop_codon:yes gene_type:complete